MGPRVQPAALDTVLNDHTDAYLEMGFTQFALGYDWEVETVATGFHGETSETHPGPRSPDSHGRGSKRHPPGLVAVAGILLVPTGVGFALSSRLRARVEGALIRAAILWLSAVAGFALLVKSVLL
jgi:hypothetical protein